MLGDEEDKLKQAKAQGMAPSVDQNLGQLSHKYSTSGMINNVKKLVTFVIGMMNDNKGRTHSHISNRDNSITVGLMVVKSYFGICKKKEDVGLIISCWIELLQRFH